MILQKYLTIMQICKVKSEANIGKNQVIQSIVQIKIKNNKGSHGFCYYTGHNDRWVRYCFYKQNWIVIEFVTNNICSKEIINFYRGLDRIHCNVHISSNSSHS